MHAYKHASVQYRGWALKEKKKPHYFEGKRTLRIGASPVEFYHLNFKVDKGNQSS
jgi:hypothetical protein